MTIKDTETGRKRYAGLLPPAVLLLILAFSLVLHGTACFLPAFSPEERIYMQDEDGEPYLTEMDSYFYLRKAEEMAEEGRVVLYNNRADDPLIGQRIYDNRDDGVTPLGLSVTAYLLWRYFLSFFGISLTQTAIWMGPFFGSLSAIPAFFYVKRRAGLAGGAVAGLLTACALPFLIHTHGGFFDTDMVLALLPLTCLLCQMRSMQEEKLTGQLVYAFISAAAITVMSFFWVAFNAYYALAFLCTVFTSLILLFLPIGSLSEKPWRRKRIMLRGGWISVCLAPILLFLTGGSRAVTTLLSVLGLLRSAEGNSSAAMPGAYQFTAEMMALRKIPGWSPLSLVKADNRSLMGMLGGAIPCVLAASALLLAAGLAVYGLMRARREPSSAHADNIGILALCVDVGFLLPWLLLSLKLAFSSVRYAQIAVLPICILCGLAVGWVCSARKLISLSEGAGKRLFAGGLALAFAAVLPVCIGAWQTICSAKPTVTDSKNQAMVYIREELPEDTAVAGWWDDGYYSEYAARRRTLADGGTSSGRMNWLLAKALLTDDPRLSARILRMLNESGTDVLDDMIGQGLDEADAAGLLLDLLSCDRSAAEKKAIDAHLDLRLLDKTHPNDGNGMILTLSTDLIGKMKALCYYAFWNPDTGRSDQNAAVLASSESIVLDETREGDLAMCLSDTTVHISEDQQGHISAVYNNGRGEQYAAGRLCVWQDGIKIQDDLTDPDAKLAGIVLVKENGRYCGVVCSQTICDSILLRMLLCEDCNMDCYRLLDTWYGDAGKELSQAQRRINYLTRTAWAAQVWQLK